ncbi:MAG: hypothetical protein HQL51_12280, partial [Magnetococcales bacterium]|nr:hypothetical protein [Magnetococcales bacterium]
MSETPQLPEMSEIPPPPGEIFDEIITDPEVICDYLTTQLLEEDRIELEIDHDVRLFFSYLRDQPPEWLPPPPPPPRPPPPPPPPPP